MFLKSPIHALGCLAFALLATVCTTSASDIRISGNVSWRIQGGACTLNVSRLGNESPAGSRSGSLRVCLWVTRSTFPQTGYRVAMARLNPLKGGYYYNGLSLKTDVSLPKVTGDHLFTISVEEFGSGRWITRSHRSTGFQYLKKGKFAKRPPWKAPNGKVIKAPANLKVGTLLTITLQGFQQKSSGPIAYVPVGSQLKMRIRLDQNGRTLVFGGSQEQYWPDGAPAYYKYSRAKDKYANKTRPVGRLYLDYGSASEKYGGVSYGDHRLFFQGPKRGFYKAIDYQGAINFLGTSWGIFRIK